MGKGLLFAGALVVTLSACDSGLGGYVVTADCSAHVTCDSCTPVLGCGWCTAAGGSGVCVSDPDYCPTQEFSWTWNIAGCGVAADASVGTTVEAAAFDVSIVDASTGDTSVEDSPSASSDVQADGPQADSLLP